MESKTKKMIIIGALIFLAVVVATLAITLPLTLINHDEQANNTTSSNNSTITTPSVSNNETNTTMTTEPMKVQSPTNDPSAMDAIPLQDIWPSLQQEPSTGVTNKARKLLQQSSVPLSSNLDNQADITGSKSKSLKK